MEARRPRRLRLRQRLCECAQANAEVVKHISATERCSNIQHFSVAQLTEQLCTQRLGPQA
jgi:hypothetical protein